MVYDGVARAPSGNFIGLEVKSGSAIKTAAQATFDAGVSIDSPAFGIGLSKDITITHTITIRR